jgi:HNH endonuclease
MSGFGVKQMDSMMYFAQMVAVGKMLPPDEFAALEAWDSTMVGKGGLGTSDWPGWRKYIGEPPWHAWAPPPKPKPRPPLPAALRKQVFERDGYRCRQCDGWEDLEADHVVPWSRGGKHELGNLQTLCGRCNRAKGARLP